MSCSIVCEDCSVLCEDSTSPELSVGATFTCARHQCLTVGDQMTMNGTKHPSSEFSKIKISNVDGNFRYEYWINGNVQMAITGTKHPLHKLWNTMNLKIDGTVKSGLHSVIYNAGKEIFVKNLTLSLKDGDRISIQGVDSSGRQCVNIFYLIKASPSITLEDTSSKYVILLDWLAKGCVDPHTVVNMTTTIDSWSEDFNINYGNSTSDEGKTELSTYQLATVAHSVSNFFVHWATSTKRCLKTAGVYSSTLSISGGIDSDDGLVLFLYDEVYARTRRAPSCDTLTYERENYSIGFRAKISLMFVKVHFDT